MKHVSSVREWKERVTRLHLKGTQAGGNESDLCCRDTCVPRPHRTAWKTALFCFFSFYRIRGKKFAAMSPVMEQRKRNQRERAGKQQQEEHISKRQHERERSCFHAERKSMGVMTEYVQFG